MRRVHTLAYPAHTLYASQVPKQRVTITVDEDLVVAALAAVENGHAESLSGWVTAAMAERNARDQRLAALGDLIADFEAVNGPI